MIEEKKTEEKENENKETEEKDKLGLWQIVSSTLAAALGVQSRKNRERDFEKGKPIHFIIAGIVFTAVFVLIVVIVVNLVLADV